MAKDLTPIFSNSLQSLTASLIARAEGLTAHAEAAEVRDEILGE